MFGHEQDVETTDCLNNDTQPNDGSVAAAAPKRRKRRSIEERGLPDGCGSATYRRDWRSESGYGRGMRLGSTISDGDKVMLGVSDGFDRSLPMSKVMLSVFAAFHEWFSDQLRAKVNRGMDDAFHRGNNIRPPAIRNKLVDAVDADGNPIVGRDGEQLKMLAKDEPAAKVIHQIFVRYAVKGWSRNRIARRLNEMKFGDQQWDARRVKQVLTRYKYLGINVENMTRAVRKKCKKTDKTKKVIVKRPRSEWKVKRMRHLRIVSRDLWKKAQKRLEASAKAYPRSGKATVSRTEVNPTTLVRPKCGCCRHEMSLGRSGEYASFTCLNGRDGKHDCTYRGYKPVKKVEQPIVKHVLDEILTDEKRFGHLVRRANQFLIQVAAKPKVDTSGWKR